ncbi:hypothetical protein GCM10009548_76450 [Streptomyces malaysiensis subsp. malaysiensis]
MDLDLRKLRYFVAVAEELHFARAAERLHIAQPVLSRQIRSLEHDLGTELFDRDRRGTLLTPAGKQLLEDALPLLASVQALTRRVKTAARDTPELTIGFMPGITLTPATVAFTGRHPGVNVRLLRTSWDDQVEVLRDGRADVSVVRLPVDQEGLEAPPPSTPGRTWWPCPSRASGPTRWLSRGRPPGAPPSSTASRRPRRRL